MANYTPMIQQYLQVKNENKDAILFFRLGDFYEMFFEDAVTASRELDIVLTARDGGASKIPMCGVPYHAANNYIHRLINKGYKVAICEQMEDPKMAKGIVKREVTRIITPGTIMDDIMLDESRNNYLAAIVDDKDIIGFAYIDISTGVFMVTEITGNDIMVELEGELHRISPAECLIPEWSDLKNLWENHTRDNIVISNIKEDILNLSTAREVLQKHFGVASLEGYGVKTYTSGIKAAGAILSFLYDTQKGNLLHIQSLRAYNTRNYMDMDYSTRRNLELTSTLREGKREGSLYSILDCCMTSMGKRTLRNWIEQPLIDVNQINLRLDAVEELKNNLILRNDIGNTLKEISDLERLAGKIGSELANPRDLLAIKNSLAVLPGLINILAGCSSQLLYSFSQIDTIDEVGNIIEQAIDENAPLTIKDGGVIKAGFNQEIDELKELSRDGSKWLIDFENQEKAKTGIKYLKVGFNKVFGYFIEISKSNLSMVPDNYIRKQTLVNTERFITQELKVYEEKILGAREKLLRLEYEQFKEIRTNLLDYIGRLQKTARDVAILDVLYSLAEVAYNHDYIRPTIGIDGKIYVKAGRHPVVEQFLKETRFVPNDLKMDTNNERFALITGPNMGGKSTYMRQNALLVLMAQMGSFIPADEAYIGVVDRIFTRVGAADDLAAGQSTFMVEMVEVANILNNATNKSLVILDEIGRGTSTYDGLSIAQAVSEYLYEKIGARTLFATHYHELTTLVDKMPGIFNLCVSVMETGDTVVFLRKVLPGKADKSYGIHVARLAGLPVQVLERSQEVLDGLERIDYKPETNIMTQMSLFNDDKHPVLSELGELEVDNLTPRDALMLVYKWKETIKG